MSNKCYINTIFTLRAFNFPNSDELARGPLRPCESSIMQSISLILVLLASLVSCSRRTKRSDNRYEKPTDAGSCSAPDFSCPSWAPCCSKHGYCGSTADYCAYENCLGPNCWGKERRRRSYSSTTTSSDDEYERRGSRPSGAYRIYRKDGVREKTSRPAKKRDVVYRSNADVATRYTRRGPKK